MPRWKMKSWTSLLNRLLAVGLLAPSSVPASLITTDFSGVLTAQFASIPARFNGIFAVGDTFTGRYIYNTELPSTLFVPPGTTFYDGFTEFTVSINGSSWSASLAAGEVSNNQGPVDAFGIRTGNTSGPFGVATGPVIAGATLREIQLQFRDETATAFSSSALPTSIIDLSDFAASFITLPFRDTSSNTQVTLWGEIRAVSGTITPNAQVGEPHPISLLLIGLAGLGVTSISRCGRDSKNDDPSPREPVNAKVTSEDAR